MSLMSVTFELALPFELKNEAIVCRGGGVGGGGSGGCERGKRVSGECE